MSGASIINLLFDLIEYDRTTDTIEDFKFTIQQGWDYYLDLGTRGLPLLPDTDTGTIVALVRDCRTFTTLTTVVTMTMIPLILITAM